MMKNFKSKQNREPPPQKKTNLKGFEISGGGVLYFDSECTTPLRTVIQSSKDMGFSCDGITWFSIFYCPILFIIGTGTFIAFQNSLKKKKTKNRSKHDNNKLLCCFFNHSKRSSHSSNNQNDDPRKNSNHKQQNHPNQLKMSQYQSKSTFHTNSSQQKTSYNTVSSNINSPYTPTTPSNNNINSNNNNNSQNNNNNAYNTSDNEDENAFPEAMPSKLQMSGSNLTLDTKTSSVANHSPRMVHSSNNGSNASTPRGSHRNAFKNDMDNEEEDENDIDSFFKCSATATMLVFVVGLFCALIALPIDHCNLGSFYESNSDLLDLIKGLSIGLWLLGYSAGGTILLTIYLARLERTFADTPYAYSKLVYFVAKFGIVLLVVCAVFVVVLVTFDLLDFYHPVRIISYFIAVSIYLLLQVYLASLFVIRLFTVKYCNLLYLYIITLFSKHREHTLSMY